VSRLEDLGRESGFYFTADELMDATFPEPRWAVPGLVAEGLTLLVGSPKLGKSWLCLGVAVAVASGGRALGTIPVQQGAALYCALEDNPRRLQSRLSALLRGDSAPALLSITTKLPRQPQAVEVVGGWLDDNPAARLVVVDVMRKVRGQEDVRADRYSTDYDLVGAFKTLADKHSVAVVLVHHTRKMADDDVINEVSGSTGLTGAADAILVMRRSRNTALAELHVTGRDIAEAQYAVTFDPTTGTWVLSDESPADARLTDERRTVLAAVTAAPGIGPKALSEQTGMTHDNARQILRRMATDQQLDSDGQGRYYTPQNTLSQVSPLSQLTGMSDTSDTCDTPSEVTA
jgi:hypothetical protein